MCLCLAGLDSLAVPSASRNQIFLDLQQVSSSIGHAVFKIVLVHIKLSLDKILMHSYKSRSWLHDFHLSAEVPLGFKVRISYLLSPSDSVTCIFLHTVYHLGRRSGIAPRQGSQKQLVRLFTWELGRTGLRP